MSLRLSTIVSCISVVLASSVTSKGFIPFPHHQFDSRSWNSQNPSCSGSPLNYVVLPSLGKGLGVFAVRALEVGDIVMQEAPALLVHPPPFRQGMGYNVTEVGIRARAAFEELSEDAQAEIMSLTAYYRPAEARLPGFDLLKAIFSSNAYNTGADLGLFPKIARINHSCRPNAGYSWNAAIGKRVVYASRKIGEGEEITVSYIPLLLSVSERQKRLDPYGFKCGCDACAAEESARKAGDRRRRDIRDAFNQLERESISDLVNDKAGNKKAQQLARQSAKLAHLVEEEQLPDYYAKASRLAAIFHARIQDWEQATRWAQKSYELRRMADAESKETKEMHALTNNLIASWNNEGAKP
ncbi:SET domain-containing protein [Lojkania enalia]|uniref:SET domain-containing protein n=1 Tax=Lojkania enalia TaxID=147567 RepID=A0A9P4K383_9PLEO|nr:SET domain-containing protein [Didymosphaeria enalia]